MLTLISHVFSFNVIKRKSHYCNKIQREYLITDDIAKNILEMKMPLKDHQERYSEGCSCNRRAANSPADSHLHLIFVLPMSSIDQQIMNLKNKVWGNFNYYTTYKIK